MNKTVELTRQLAEIAKANDLAELEFQEGDVRIHIVLESEAAVATAVPQVVLAHGHPMAAPAPVAQAPAAEPAAPAIEGDTIDSPLPGVFYRAPRPGAPAFVEEGQQVAPGQTLCIVEAMKLMNEISAERPGKIMKILVNNGDAVEEGQPLFVIA